MEIRTLNNGIEVPAIACGLGSALGWDEVNFFNAWPFARKLNYIARRVRDKHRRKLWLQRLLYHLDCGYRLIDHNKAYGDSHLIGEAIALSGLPRDAVKLSSRFSNQDQYSGDLYSKFKHVKAELGNEPIDLFGFLWPVPEHYIKTYRFLEKLYKDGEIKAIAICNCHEHHLERIMQECEIVPALNQIEVHPLFTQKKLISFCKQHDICVQAYTPLARNNDRLLKVRAINDCVAKYQKTVAQIILRWCTQQGIIPIPKSTNKERIKQNISIFDFSLTQDEMDRIDTANLNSRLRFDPDNCDYTRL